MIFGVVNMERRMVETRHAGNWSGLDIQWTTTDNNNQ